MATTMDTQRLIEKDLRHLWHPTSQMKDYEAFPPLPIKQAKGSCFELYDGTKILDGISSWWCKSLGHGHPRLQEALTRQMRRFEHVILANTTNSVIVELSEKLASLTPHLKKAFYASDGACAIEIAIKMSLASRHRTGQTERNQIMSLKNGYHGETALTLSLSDVDAFKKEYMPILIKTELIQSIPYTTSTKHPVWADCEAQWQIVEAQLNQKKETLSAIVFEPIVQGAGGMQIYSKDFLSRLRRWATANDVHLIADEIMTGLGRTGLPLACQHAEIEPDFLCLAKNLTAGWLPMSVVLTADAIYDLFYDDYETGKAFLHSHTHSGNALAAAVALECFKIMAEEGIYEGLPALESSLFAGLQAVQDQTGKLKNLRGIGGIVAADLDLPDSEANGRWGYKICREAVKRGVLLRPIGNALYWLPPLNIKQTDIDKLTDVTTQAIEVAFA